MKSGFSTLKFTIAIVIFLLIVIFSTSRDVQAANTIAGTIYDNARNPLADIDIELLDEFYRVFPSGRQKTNSSGRYEFAGLSDGRFYLRIYAFRYDLMDETREIVLTSINALPGQSGSSYNVEDFYLQPRRGGLRDSQLGVVFFQEIPKEAKGLYDQALKDLSKKRSDEGFVGLQKALEIFPTYFNALQAYGSELLVRKQYLPAAYAFMKAAEVNPKSALAYYNVGYALHFLGDQYYKSALTALNEALRLAPASTPVLYFLGVIERSMGNFAKAEKHLLQAKKLSPTKLPEIHKELAQLYANDLKKYSEAAIELEQYIRASKLSDADEKVIKEKIVDLRQKAKTRNSQ